MYRLCVLCFVLKISRAGSGMQCYSYRLDEHSDYSNIPNLQCNLWILLF